MSPTMDTAQTSIARNLKRLANISWLTSRQLSKLAVALRITRFDKHSIMFGAADGPAAIHILLSGVASITCRNRKGLRTMLIMVAPGMIPGFPAPVVGVAYNLRCEAVTSCQIGTTDLKTFIRISLGILSANFTRMAGNYIGRWDLVQLRCANFMSCTLEERLVIALLELSEHFGTPHSRGVLLTVAARHKDLAELVGASRPRVTEYLSSFERGHMIIRQGRQFIVNRARLESFLTQGHTA